MKEYNPHLPVEDALPELIDALARLRCAVLSAPPGAGKTTRVPLALLDAAWLEDQKILMLEPRRLAARRAAEYMAQRLGERVGWTVGYRIRGDAFVSDRTRLEVVTEGILTRMLHTNPDLPGVGLVIFDEFHERSIHADIGLAFALDVQKHLKEDLRLLVMSATLDGVAVAHMLGDAPVVESRGVIFPVETKYARFVVDKSLEIRVTEAVSRALIADEGDVLVFLPGMREIRRAEDELRKRLSGDIVVHLLHGELPRSVQESALMPDKQARRKVILATSIAETSLTIDGVKIVVDSGLVRSARFDSRRGMSGLVTIPVSRAVADQRRGRAGRQSAGICYRLWTEAEHAQLPDYPVPEIRVADLAHAALDLASWGAPTGEGLLFLDPPPAAHLVQAQTVLKRLGAMTDDGRLTPHGRAMAALPIHPRLAHMIIKGKEIRLGAAACELAAILEERDSLFIGVDKDVDLVTRIDRVRQQTGQRIGASERVASQTQRLMEMTGQSHIDRGGGDSGGLLVALAYPERIARRRPERSGLYQLSGGGIAELPAGSLLARSEYIAIANLEAGSGNARIYLAAPISESDLETAFAGEIVVEEEIEWNVTEKRVQARCLRKLGAVILRDEPLELEGEEVVRALVEGIRRTGLHCLPWDKESERFRSRVQWARAAMPELPDLSDESLKSSVAEWLGPFLEGMWNLQHLQRLRLTEILRSRLSAQGLLEIDRLAPSHLQVPSGSRIALEYSAAGHPTLSVKLQELFGLTETPRVGGTTPVTIHLLSPAGRSLAVTQDLRSFWENVYPEIRKQLRARYPKHPWPEDPLTATPTRRTTRKR